MPHVGLEETQNWYSSLNTHQLLSQVVLGSLLQLIVTLWQCTTCIVKMLHPVNFYNQNALSIVEERNIAIERMKFVPKHPLMFNSNIELRCYNVGKVKYHLFCFSHTAMHSICLGQHPTTT